MQSSRQSSKQINRVIIKSFLIGAVTLLMVGDFLISTALAIPTLQLYIEGSTYDKSTETWVITTTNPFKLWVIGDVGAYGSILDVKLSAAVSTSEIVGSSISLSSTTTGLITDPSTPIAPTTTANFPSGDGAIPVKGDGSSLPTHGIYGPGTSFFEWRLGDFTLTDSPIGDFIDSYPSSFPNQGQVNVYDVTISGFTQIHFDAYDHIITNSDHLKYVKAPFSHDAGATGVPEPSTLLLLGSGLLGLGALGVRRKKDGK